MESIAPATIRPAAQLGQAGELKDREFRQSAEAVQRELEQALPWIIQPGVAIGSHEGYQDMTFGPGRGLGSVYPRQTRFTNPAMQSS